MSDVPDFIVEKRPKKKRKSKWSFARFSKNFILEKVRLSIENNLNKFLSLSREEIFNQRKEKFLSIGRDKGFTIPPNSNNSLSIQNSNYLNFFHYIFYSIY